MMINLLDVALANKMRFEEVLICWSIHSNNMIKLNKYLKMFNITKILESLKQKGFIIEYEEQLIPNVYNCNKLFNQDVDESSNWIEEYRLLFKGIKNKSMGTKQLVYTNMTWFAKEYPEYYNKDIIMAAAKKHIAYASKFKKETVIQADYFIKKNGHSELATYCEQELLVVDANNSEIKKYGQSID